MTGRGYLYIASGKGCVKSALLSAKSLRRCDRGAHITLVTDADPGDAVFDEVVIRGHNASNRGENLFYKVRNIYGGAPYEKTLFVDADTYFYGDPSGLFGLLDHFDVCMTKAPADANLAPLDGERLTGYTPYNTGVILFRKGEAMEKLFSDWENLHQRNVTADPELGYPWPDQVAFMEALLHSEARMYVLSAVWNARFPFPISLNGPVMIAHGRHDDYEELGRRINSNSAPRCWDPERQKCIRPLTPRIRKLRRWMRRAFRRFKRRSV